MDPATFTVMSLCTGIGGLDLGLRLAVPAARTICMVEREAFAIATLVDQMEKGAMDACPIWTDLARFNGKAWCGTVDCIVGGYPCQPFSVAGRRAGEEDPRHMWPHIARIVRDVQPAMVFFENVAGHLSLGFEQVAEDLQDMGYVVEAGLFTASEVGAPHRRQRLFILAHHHRNGCESQRFSKVFDGERSALGHDADRCGGEASCLEYPTSVGFGERRAESAVRGGRHSASLAGGAVADAALSRSQERTGQREYIEQKQQAVERRERGIFPPAPNDLEAWQRIPEHLQPAAQPAVRGMVDGNASRVDRLRALGNGVVPLVAAVAFRTLARRAGLS